MGAQSEGAAQIREAMARLSEGVEQTAQSLREFQSTATGLNAAAKELQDGISRFKVSSDK